MAILAARQRAVEGIYNDVTTASRSAHYEYHSTMNRPLHVDFKEGTSDVMQSAYLYDRAGRIETVRSHLTGSGDVVSSHRYRYDPANRRVEAWREDGSFWKYGYNSKGELIDSKKYLRGEEPLAGYQWDYDYDDIGNRLSMQSGGNSAGTGQRTTQYGNGSKSGAANSLNQYTGITNPGSFDITGTDPDADAVTISTSDSVEAQPIAGTTQTHFRFDVDSAASGASPGWDAVTVTGSDTNDVETGSHYNPPINESLAYDFDGNLTSDGRWDYTWNGENRLIEMETTSTAASAGVLKQKLEFAYDSGGRRISKIVSSWSGSAWVADTHELFVYDGWNLVMRIDDLSSGAPSEQKYFWGLDLSGTPQGAGGVGGLLMAELGSDVCAYAYDGNGNVTALVTQDSSSAALAAAYEYDGFGTVVSESVALASGNPFCFSTKYRDESGLVYYGYRHFDARKGRWISRDPSGVNFLTGEFNLYSFTSNGSFQFVDYLGLFKLDSVSAGIAQGGASGVEIAAALGIETGKIGVIDGTATTVALVGAALAQDKLPMGSGQGTTAKRERTTALLL